MQHNPLLPLHASNAQVEIAAPGASIYSSVSTSDSAYAYYSGTSMATPYVSGARTAGIPDRHDARQQPVLTDCPLCTRLHACT